MPLTWVLDILLVLVLIGYFIYGYRRGLVHSVSVILGVIVGGMAAVFLMPFVSSWVPGPEWRGPATLGAAGILIVGGLAAGAAVGQAIMRPVRKSPLRIVDRILGATVNLVVAALIASTVAFGIGSMGNPFLSQPIASSSVLRTIDRLTPDPVTTFLAKMRSVALTDGLPRIVDAIGGPAPAIPNVSTGTAELTAAARSVVRITGNAYSCGQNQSGTGFVIAPNRVLTNAHVVAGVSQPVIESSSDGAKVGDIVYFDPVDDLAVIAVRDFAVPPLEFAQTLVRGDAAIVDGYPFGGPFSSHPAEVVSVGGLPIDNIYGENPTSRDVYTLAADVQPGESGGPLLTEQGEVAGVIFAKGATTPNLGYALTMEEVAPIVVRAPSYGSPVSSGACASG